MRSYQEINSGLIGSLTILQGERSQILTLLTASFVIIFCHVVYTPLTCYDFKILSEEDV